LSGEGKRIVRTKREILDALGEGAVPKPPSPLRDSASSKNRGRDKGRRRE